MSFKKILIQFMRLARRVFRNTPIQRLRITTFIYKHAARRAFGTESVEVPFRGSRILYPGDDYTTLPTLLDGIYELNELDAVMSYLDSLSSPITAVDVGANVGIWTVLMAKHKNIKQVLAFEPSPTNISFLRANLELNNVQEKVTVIESAVLDINGEVNFDDDGNGATKHLSKTGTSKVSGVSLDSYLNGASVELIKIDVEGYEPLVLEGCWKTIETSLPTLFIEYSLPNVRTAGLSWNLAGEKLCSLYSKFLIISESGSKVESNFESLAHDNRLLNLQFSTTTNN